MNLPSLEAEVWPLQPGLNASSSSKWRLFADTKAMDDAAAVAGGRSLPTTPLLQALVLRWPQRARPQRAKGNAAAAVPGRRGTPAPLLSAPLFLPLPGTSAPAFTPVAVLLSLSQHQRNRLY